MEIEERLATLKQIGQVAALAGLKGRLDDNGRNFRMMFSLGDDRDQLVMVRPTGKTPKGQTIVTFYSAALVIPDGMFSGISKDQAIDLLKRNENLMFARFGLWQQDKQVMIVASFDHILETLDPEEMEATSWYVAIAADNYEKEHGKDDF